MNKVRQKIHDIIYEADTPAGQVFDISLIIVIIISVILVAVETIGWINEKYHVILNVAEWIITALFTIDNSTNAALPTAQTAMQSNTNYFECLNDGSNTVNPYFGSLKQSYDAVTADMPSSYKFLQIAASNSS